MKWKFSLKYSVNDFIRKIGSVFCKLTNGKISSQCAVNKLSSHYSIRWYTCLYIYLFPNKTASSALLPLLNNSHFNTHHHSNTNTHTVLRFLADAFSSTTIWVQKSELNQVLSNPIIPSETFHLAEEGVNYEGAVCMCLWVCTCELLSMWMWEKLQRADWLATQQPLVHRFFFV